MIHKAFTKIAVICMVIFLSEQRNITERGCGPRGKCTYDEIMLKVSKCFSNHLTIDDEVRGKKPLTTLDGLEARLTRQMEALSIRALRGIRRIETKMQEVSKSGLERLVRLDAEAKPRGPEDQRIISERSIICNDRLETKKCPTLFTGVDDWKMCYLFSNFNATWQQARDYCAALGANLVILETMNEHFLVNLLVKQKVHDARNETAWWTAGNYNANGKQWRWASQLHLQEFRFHKWNNGIPAPETTKCMVLPTGDTHGWKSEDCAKSFNFICQKEKQMKMKK